MLSVAPQGRRQIGITERSDWTAITEGLVSPAQGLELVALVEAQRAVVKELQPAAMYGEPTPEQLAEQKRRNEAYAKIFDHFQAEYLR